MPADSAERASAGTAPADASRKKDSGGGISPFLGKVLAQLSISSWLPAAMLVTNSAVLLQMHSDKSLAIGAAISKLTAKPVGILVVLLFALLIATMVTQAFEYEVIRLLEGYVDFGHGALHHLMVVRIRRHGRKLNRLEGEREAVRLAAFAEARAVMIDAGYAQRHLDIIEKDLHDLPQDARRRTVDTALSIDWHDHLAAATRYRLDALDARLSRYPEPSRLLPTRLGNTLRAAEDALPLADGEDLVGFVIHNYDRLPQAVREEHQDYRTRLDMYCTLALVFLALSVIAVLSLRAIAGPGTLAATVIAYLGMAWVSYEAAIASARGYGDVLREIAHLTEDDEQADNAASSSSALRKFLHSDVMPACQRG